MKAKITLLLYFFIYFAANAQTVTPENRIVVIGEASINVPADQAKFYVSLESTDSTSIDKVYQKHRLLEEKIVRLLQDLQIPPSDISYSLFSVNKSQDYVGRKRVSFFIGRQTVTFTINSIEKLSTIQARLINEGFSSFNSQFTSTQLDQHQTEVLEKAIKVATEKANVMAAAADRKIKRVVKVADTEDTDPTFRNYRVGMLEEQVVVGYGDINLTDIPQTIRVSASVKVVFELK